MHQLLQAIKTALEAITGVDVFVTPDENFLPNNVRLPAVGIKDGAVRRVQGAGMTQVSTLEVKIIPWVFLAKDEASILGDASSSEPGIIALSDEIHAVLDDNLLAVAGVESAFSSGESGSVLGIMDAGDIVNKVITYTYEKQGDRPCMS